MLPTYDECCGDGPGKMYMSRERALWEIARQLSRKNDLLEVEMLCKTADALRNAAKGSLGDLHDDGYIWAEELACMAHKKICEITGAPFALNDEEETRSC